MKKLLVAIIIAVILTSGAAFAQDSGFWAGVDYGYNNLQWSDVDGKTTCKYNQGSGVYGEIGYKFTENIAARARYGYNWGSSSQWYEDVTIAGSLQDYYVQAMYFQPVAKSFDVYAAAGIGGINQCWTAKTLGTNTDMYGSAVAIPVSVGVDYKLTNQLSVNVDLTYVFAVNPRGEINNIGQGIVDVAKASTNYFVPAAGLKFSF